MANVLHLDASPRGARSHSRRMTRTFVEQWKQIHPDDTVTYRDIGRNPISHVDETWIAAAFTPAEQRTPELKDALRISDELVDEFLAATSDTSVLGDTGSAIVDESYPIAEGFVLAERAKAEQAVLTAAHQTIRSVVLRLPLYIYGRGGGTSYVPMRLQEVKEIGVTHYVAPGQHHISAVQVDDVAQLYVLALEQAPAGSIFHAATESGISEKAIALAMPCPHLATADSKDNPST